MTNLDSILKSRDITLPTKVRLVKAMVPRQHIKKQRHYFANKGLSSQSYCFSSSQVWMWELDYNESWAQKNWWFWTLVLGKTLESPLAWKEIQPVHPKGDQSWVFIGRTGAEAVTPIPWPPHAKSWLKFTSMEMVMPTNHQFFIAHRFGTQLSL